MCAVNFLKIPLKYLQNKNWKEVLKENIYTSVFFWFVFLLPLSPHGEYFKSLSLSSLKMNETNTKPSIPLSEVHAHESSCAVSSLMRRSFGISPSTLVRFLNLYKFKASQQSGNATFKCWKSMWQPVTECYIITGLNERARSSYWAFFSIQHTETSCLEKALRLTLGGQRGFRWSPLFLLVVCHRPRSRTPRQKSAVTLMKTTLVQLWVVWLSREPQQTFNIFSASAGLSHTHTLSSHTHFLESNPIQMLPGQWRHKPAGALKC